MRLLWCCSPLPIPADDGNRQRHLNLVKAAAKISEVTLLCPTSGQVDQLDASRELGVEAVIAPQTTVIRRSFRRMTSTPACMVPKEVDAMGHLASSAGDFDLAVSALYTAPAAFAASTRAIIVDDQNYEAELYRRLFRFEPRAVRKVGRFRDWISVRAFERRWLRKGKVVMVTSDADGRALAKSIPGCPPVATIPNGVDLDGVEFHNGPRDPNTLVMIGGMAYAPNVDSVQLMVHRVLPELWRVRPDARLWVVGKDPPREVLALAGERVIVTGRVPSVMPYLRNAAATIVALRSGGGTRIKVLEAMAAGTPVVSTALGIEGLDLEAGKHVVVSPAPDGLAKAILACLSNEDEARAMAARARALVEECYGWAAIGDRFAELLRLVADDSGPAKKRTDA
jgi:glycosyltransferase involved in cell wall biosynthesis